MGPARPAAIRFASPFALLFVVAAASLGCYRPAIVEGGLACNLDAGAKACPEGFKCDTDGRCRRNLLGDGGADSTSGDTSVDMDGGGDDTGMCLPPKMNCTPTPGGGLCDPYCQTGCGCHEKCSVNTAGTLTCKVPPSGFQVRTLLQPCQIQNGGTANQNDQCAPGLVCVEDACGSAAGSGRCYQFCRNDGECTNAPCNKDAGGGVKVCDVPYDDCVPLAAGMNTGCVGNALMCYLSTNDPSKTICDCEFPPGLREMDVCARSRECNPGLVCVDPNGQGTKLCTRVCRLAVSTDCSFGSCRVYMDNGVANATYGYCGSG
ncbi:MAG TPA: hypothetical protein VIF57_18160 [Polyangia bacterium]|jgi:hypothetical protein